MLNIIDYQTEKTYSMCYNNNNKQRPKINSLTRVGCTWMKNTKIIIILYNFNCYINLKLNEIEV